MGETHTRDKFAQPPNIVSNMVWKTKGGGRGKDVGRETTIGDGGNRVECVFGILCRKDIILEVQGLSLVKKHLKHEGCQSKIIVRSHLFNTTLDNTTALI